MQYRNQLYEKRFGRCIVRVWNIGGIYPWAFAVQEDGRPEMLFGGVPNWCSTRHSALMRAWWRTKWINNGTWDHLYK